MANPNPGGDSETARPLTTSISSKSGFNFGLMALYQVMVRTGWIFKTESIIMPAVLDLIGGQGWLRGCLPMLNRFGQSIPPLLISDWLRNRKIKKWALAAATILMGICFLMLSLVWWLSGGTPSWWLPIVFLVIYGVFFSSVGINQLVFSTMIGKLIWTQRRGRLMLISTTLGAISAISFAWILLNLWLSETSGNFVCIFAFTGCAFLCAGLLTVFLKEEEDTPTGTKRTAVELFRLSIATLAMDKNFRRLAIMASLFGMSMTLFPHYQALVRGESKLGLTAMIPWLIAQNIGASLFAIPTGWAGDRFGYRIVLRTLMLAICMIPIFSLVLARMGPTGQPLFIFLFCLIGLTPVTMRGFFNYTLEIVKEKYHPRYLSTLGLCMAAPAILTSSLLGAMIDWFGFEPIFVSVAALVFVGWLLTMGLEEPRHK